MLQRNTLRCLVIFSLLWWGSYLVYGQGVSCSVQHVSTDAAAKFYAQGKYSEALTLYADEAKKNPQDTAAVADQIRTLLLMNAVDAAAKIAEASAAAHPNDAGLAIALGEVRFRQGDMPAAMAQYNKAWKLDACLARLHYDVYRLLWAQSKRASAFSELRTAHQLMPDDAEIQFAWINHLPLRERVVALDTYIAKDSSGSKETHDGLSRLDERLHAVLAAKSGGCRLESGLSATTLPFVYLLEPNDSRHFQGLGFDVHVNGKASARLELDTGASGILINRIAAKRAGLVPIASDKIGGIGDHSDTGGYWAYADSIQVGDLHFHNCLIEVSDQRSIVGVDGLIGADTFENFHVTLDMPLRQMALSPLPTRPGETTRQTTLNAAGVSDATSTNNTAGKTGVAQPVAILYHDRYVAPEMKGWMPFYRFGHEILLPGTLKDGKPRLFLMDTGANRSNLSIRAAKSIGKIHTDYDYQIKGISGKVDKVYEVDEADLVFANMHDPLRQIPAFNIDNISNDTGTEVSGILGLDTLVLLAIDVDYRDGLIRLNYDANHGKNAWIR